MVLQTIYRAIVAKSIVKNLRVLSEPAQRNTRVKITTKTRFLHRSVVGHVENGNAGKHDKQALKNTASKISNHRIENMEFCENKNIESPHGKYRICGYKDKVRLSLHCAHTIIKSLLGRMRASGLT